jgi:hypothetical protein
MIFILQERLSGRSARSIGKQLSLTVGEVNASLDRTLPKIDNARRRHISLDLHRLDELLKTFFARAIDPGRAIGGENSRAKGGVAWPRPAYEARPRRDAGTGATEFVRKNPRGHHPPRWSAAERR